MRIERIDIGSALGSATREDLSLVVEVATLMCSGRGSSDLEAALDRLRTGCNADVCELFLSDPDGRNAYLVAHLGEDLPAFSQRDCFASGEGFPGMVLRTGAAISTENLPDEAEFLRSRVKTLDYGLLVCAPLWDRDRVCGCLLLAWKGSPPGRDRAVPLASMVAGAIGPLAETALRRFRREASPMRGSLAVEAERLRDAVGADSCVLWIAEADGDGLAVAATAGSVAADRTVGAAAPISRDMCPAVRMGRVMVLGGREGWPGPCLSAGCGGKTCYCLPLMDGDRVCGLATMMYRTTAPIPRTRGVPTALWLRAEIEGIAAENRRSDREVCPPDATRLRIRGFGTFEVELDGRPLGKTDFGRDKARELLALMVAHGRPLSGDRLARELWPDTADPARARNRFDVTLSALRSALEPGGGPDWTFVRRRGRVYYLEPTASVTVDLWRFEHLVREARSAEARGRPAGEVVALLEEATSLFQGDPFHDAFSSDWLDGIVIRLRQQMLDALSRLADLAFGLDEPERALAALRRAVTADSLREDSGHPLIPFLTTSSREPEALVSLQRLKVALSRNYGFAPSLVSGRLRAIQALPDFSD